jgi:hypothetical protein
MRVRVSGEENVLHSGAVFFPYTPFYTRNYFLRPGWGAREENALFPAKSLLSHLSRQINSLSFLGAVGDDFPA